MIPVKIVKSAWSSIENSPSNCPPLTKKNSGHKNQMAQPSQTMKKTEAHSSVIWWFHKVYLVS